MGDQSQFIHSLVKYSDMSFNVHEKIAVELVARGGIKNTDISKNEVTGEDEVTIRGENFNYKSVNDDYLDTSVFAAYPSVLDENFCLALKHNNNPTISGDVSNNLGQYFKILQSSHTLHDANIVVDLSHLIRNFDASTGIVLNNVPDPDNYSLKVEFDLDSSFHTYHRAVNSEWNTTIDTSNNLNNVGEQPVSIGTDHIFNTTKAGGLVGFNVAFNDASYTAKYATLKRDGGLQGDGTLIFTDISHSYQPSTNNLVVSKVDISENYIDGTFKIVNNPNYVDISANAGLFNVSNNMSGFPIVNNIYGINSPLPTSMNIANFNSIFSQSVLDTIRDEYTIIVDVSQVLSSGYTLSNTDTFEEIDQTNLKDSAIYMANLVSHDHSIKVTPGTISVKASTNGSDITKSSITLDYESGETLNASAAGVNGEIKIISNSPLSRVTDLSSNGLSTSAMEVWYTGDKDISNNYVGIDEELMQANDVFVKVQKVAMATSMTPSNEHLKLDNGVALSYNSSTGLANDKVDSNKVLLDCRGLASLADDNKYRVFEINNSQKLSADGQTLFTGWDVSNNLPSDISLNNFTILSQMDNLANNIGYTSMRCNLTAKTISNLSFSGKPSNWSFSVDDSNLICSSIDAFKIPIYKQAIDTNSPITYNAVYNSVSHSHMTSNLLDSVTITYSIPDVEPVEIVISQNNITRTSISSIPDEIITVNNNVWDFVGGSYLTKNDYELVRVSQSNTYSSSFTMPFGPYSNIKCTISDITENRTFNAVRNKNTLQILPRSSLSYVVIYDNSIGLTNGNLKDVIETISTPDGMFLTMNGVINLDDLKPYYGVVEGLNIIDWQEISDEISIDMFYGSVNLLELIDDVENVNSSADISIIIEPVQIGISNIQLSAPKLYFSFLLSDNENLYSMNVFESNAYNLGNILIQPNNLVNTITSENNFSSLQEDWLGDEHDYSLNVQSDTNGTIFTIKNGTQTIVTITEINNMVFLGKRYIFSSKYDILASTKNVDDVQNTEIFSLHNDNLVDSKIILPNVQGIYISKNAGFVGASSIALGSYIQANLKPDSVKINLIGTVTGDAVPLNSNNLTWQYVDGGNIYSCILTLPRVRGYPQTFGTLSVGNEQTYIINRSGTTVAFNIYNEEETLLATQTLTTNMYYGMTHTVNLLNYNGNTIDLGITFVSKYSIPPPSYSYGELFFVVPVNIVGDSVTFTVQNPNQSSTDRVDVPDDASEVPNRQTFTFSTTLKEYSIYTFSGSNYNNSSSQLKLRSNRVTLYTDSYPYSNVKYVITYNEGTSELYKAAVETAYNDIGNPRSFIGTWELLFINEPQNMLDTGFNIGLLNVKQNSELFRVSDVTTYLQIHCPRLIATCMSSIGTDGTSLTLPFDYNNANNDKYKVTRIFRPDDTNVYNPFAGVVEITDINGANCNLTFNNTVKNGVNNIKFTYNDQSSLSEMLTATAQMNEKVTVPGTVLKINRNYGLFPSQLHSEELFNGPITSMSQVANIDIRNIYCKLRDTNNKLYINIAQNVSLNGFTDSSAGYVEAWQTNDQSKFYNIDLQLDNTSWYKDDSQVIFNVNSNGVSSILYSSHLLFDMSYKISKVRTFKYGGINLNDYDTNNVDSSGNSSKQTLSINFMPNREYVDLELPLMSFPDDPNYVPYLDNQVRNVIIPSELNWTTDLSFNQNLVFNVAYGNSVTSGKLGSFFTCPNDATKILLFKFNDLIVSKNQFGIPIIKINWQGQLNTTHISTTQINLNPSMTVEQAQLTNYNGDIGAFSTMILNSQL